MLYPGCSAFTGAPRRVGNSLAGPQMVNVELPPDPAILLLGICPAEMKTHVHTKPEHARPQRHDSQQPKSGNNPGDHRQMKDKHHVSLHTWKSHSATQRGETLTLAATWTDPENTMLSERSQTQDTQCVIPLMGNVQNGQIHRDREWIPGCQGLGSGCQRLAFLPP